MRSTRQTIEDYIAVMNGEGEGNFLDFLSDDIVWHLPPAHPFGSVFRGRDEVLQMLARGMPIFKEGSLKITPHQITAEGDSAFAHFTLTATTGQGKEYCNEYIFRFRVGEGKITEIWESMDTQYMHALGVYDGI